MRACMLAFVAACGRIGYGADPDASIADALLDARPRCQTWSSFGPAQRITASSDPLNDDWVPRVGRDDLTLVMDTWNGTDFDIGVARRATPADSFGRAVILSEVATTDYDQAGQLSPDENRLYAMVGRGIGGLRQFARLGSGSYALALTHTNLDPVAHFWISDDELRAYWLVGTEVRLSLRQSIDAPFDAGTILAKHSFANAGNSIALTPDELELFASAPVTSMTDDHDLFVTTRPDRQSQFAPFTTLGLDTARDDVVGSVSSDGTTLYLNLDTLVLGGGNADVWIATRTCLD